MRTLASADKAEKNDLTSGTAWLWLFEIQRDATTYSRYAKNYEDVTFNGQTFTAHAIDYEPPEADAAGTQHDHRISIGDADRTEVGLLEGGYYINYPVVVYLVNSSYLTYSTSTIKFRGIVLDADAGEGGVTLRCGTHDLRKSVVPRDSLYRTYCRWDFKSFECGYAGADTTCAKSLTACAAHTPSNKSRFGGAPGLPMVRP